MRIAWCDKVAFVWGAVVYLLLFLMWSPNIAGFFGAALSMDSLRLALYTILPVWLFLRFIDLLAGGPSRRPPSRLRGLAIKAAARMEYNRAVNYGSIKPTLNGRQTGPD